LNLQMSADPAALTLGDGAGNAWLKLALGEASVAPRARLRLGLVGEQHLYGLGEGGQQFDRLGGVRRLWNFQANRGRGADIAIPLLLSNAGYGLFIDNAGRGLIEPADAEDGVWFEYGAESAGGFDLYLLGGEGLRRVLGDVADLLGHATMPPRWALGYQQSSRHFTDTAEVLGLARTMRDKRIPCDALIFLSTYGDAQGLNRGVGHLEFHPKLFTDPATVLGQLRAQHFRLFSHEYPVLHPRSPLFAEAQRAGYLLDHGYPDLSAAPRVGPAAVYKEGQRFLDFSRPEVRAWWWQQHLPLAQLGIEGWWLDGGEGPPARVELAAGQASTLHNRFDLMRQQSFAEGEGRDRPQTRPYLLCRSGGPGMQRFGAMPWSGDINTTFEAFETQIRMGLNLGMSGVPHWGTDAGGFYNVAPDNGELLVRWLQFAAFCSVFRAHGHTWRRHVPWAHGEAIEAICRRIIELRYRLMPYTYTLAWQARQDGLPTMRPLVLNYPGDPRVWDLGTQYLWGDDLLVAPVTKAGATSWTVYLPAGTWHDFWTHETHRGPAGVTVPAPLERVPLFVRGGAILPLAPVVQYAGEQKLRELTLLVYPDTESGPEGRSSFTLYEDDGETQAYLEGRFALTEVSCAAEGGEVICRIAAPQGDPGVIPDGRRYTLRVRVPRKPRQVEIAGLGRAAEIREPASPGPDAAWWMDAEGFAVVRLPVGAREARLSSDSAP
jgi:alpha-glucosidase (family GH31 glycosyl hydrolase)